MFLSTSKAAASISNVTIPLVNGTVATNRTLRSARRSISSGTKDTTNAIIGQSLELSKLTLGQFKSWPNLRQFEDEENHVALKDNIASVNGGTTCASSVLKDYKSPYNATIVEIIAKKGGATLHRTNMDEFGMGSNSIFSNFGPVVNEGRTAGGSSGGSAVAVAKGMAHLGVGTDTGGSVRLPAAYNGIVGFKPSYGVIPRYGVVPYANSLDTLGLMTRTVTGMQKIFDEDLMYCDDHRDPTAPAADSRRRYSAGPGIYKQGIGRQDARLKKLRIGVPAEYNTVEMSTEVRATWATSLKTLQDHGHKIVPISLPMTKHALSAYYVLAAAEAASNLSKYDGIRYGSRSPGSDDEDGVLYSKTRGTGIGPEVKRRILLGSFTLSSDAIDNYFIQAQKVRRLVQKDFDRVFALDNPLREPEQFDLADLPEGTPLKNKLGPEQVDVIICPTTTSSAPMIEDIANQSPTVAYTNDVYTVPASLAGLPAVSVPVKRPELEPSGNTGVGIQVIGQYWDDLLVLEVGALLDSNSS